MLEVQKVIEGITKDPAFVTVMKRIKQDWEHGRKGILEEAVHRKVQKPKLAIDPEDFMFPGL